MRPVLMSRVASMTFPGVTRWEAPTSSVGPNGDGHQFLPNGLGAWA